MQEQRINKYNKYVVAEDFLLVTKYNSIMELPTFLRAVINTTSKEYLIERKQSINALAACFLLSGQKSMPTRARKSIAGFKVREGALIGCRTTLRKKKLYAIIDKLLIFALPRLYSEKGSNTILRLASKASEKRHSNFSVRESCIRNQSHSKGTETLSREERSQLSMNLVYYKRNNIKRNTRKNVADLNYVQIEKGISSNGKQSFASRREGQIYHLALGINNLLLLPELQEFFTLFEGVRGINLGISFSNPKIKGTSLVANFFANIQKKEVLEIPQHPHNLLKDINGIVEGKRSLSSRREGKRGIDPNEIARIAPTYNSRKERNGILTLPFARSTVKEKERLENESRYDSQHKGFSEKQKLLKALMNTFCRSSDTYTYKENRNILFLTSFQYPKQYK
jgi:hypothetical protein